jgi:hypothetical protein
MKIGTALVELDSTKILKEDDEELVLPGILAREGVFPYPWGKAFRPRGELKKTLKKTFDGAAIVGKKHPETMLVTKPEIIIGKVRNVRLDENGAVHGEIHLFKEEIAPEFLTDIKLGICNKNSMGFIYTEDATKGEFNGQPYDFVQREIKVDHIAIGVPFPRDPGCTLGVDDFSGELNLELKGLVDAWDSSYVNNLPDSCFAYIEPDGKKDEEGKTVPRSLKHLPYKNAQGEIDHDHLVNALARVSQSGTLPEGGKTAAKEKLCSAVRSWNSQHSDSKIVSEVCGVKGDCLLDAFSEIERLKRLVS